ncbi:MAG: endolytic transglycosylase MltG [Halieaceae bacterium]|nr:endolytic transglycosylase MltG [Halieaceae bacterium]
MLKRRGLRLLVFSVFVSALLVAGGRAWLLDVWHQPLALPAEGVRLEVAAGEGLGAVLKRAQSAGWLSRARWVGFIAAQLGLDARMHVGEYQLAPGLDAAGLVNQLAKGDVVRYQVTLPEGISLSQSLSLLCAQPALRCLIDGEKDPRLLTLVAPHASAEGWFLPETYTYRRGESDWDILQQAHALMQRELTHLWAERDTGLPLEDPYDALRLASIVERETGVASERPQIAGVFVRRLARGMRLQTDPTVIYGLGDSYDGNLTRAHLRDAENPYNTYRIPALPPTPIALPGRASLAAVVHPADGDALYFVARGDGSHAFSATLEEHQKRVKQYQLKRRSDYRSSPQ